MKKPPKNYKDTVCHNCGKNLEGPENFCPACGQKNNRRRLSVQHFWKTLIDNFVSADSKLWTSLKYLLTKPGFVAKEYVNGKRTTFSNPFKLLLQISIFYFLLSSGVKYLHKNQPTRQQQNDFLTHVTDSINRIYKIKFDSLNQKNHFIEQLKDPNFDSEVKDSIYKTLWQIYDSQLIYPNNNHFIISEKDKILIVNKDKDTTKINKIFGQSTLMLDIEMSKIEFRKFVREYLKKQCVPYIYYPKIEHPDKFEKKPFFIKTNLLMNIVTDDIYNDSDTEDIVKKIHIKNTWLNRLAVKFSKITDITNDKKQSKLFSKKINSNIGFMLFIFLPVYALLFLILYEKHGYNYAETLVLLFFIQSAYFLVLSLALFLDFLPDTVENVGFVIINLAFVYYLYKSLRHFYEEKKRTTWLKTLLLIIPVYLIFGWLSFMILSFAVILFG